MKLQDLLKDIELGKVYTDKDRKPFEINERRFKLSSDADMTWSGNNIVIMAGNKRVVLSRKELGKLLKGAKMHRLAAGYEPNEKMSEAFGGVQAGPKFSSPEAKKVVDGALKQYAKDLRKLQYRVVKDWMTKAKDGVIDFFDLVRGFEKGDISRAYPYETKFLQSVLTKDKIVDRFRKYFGGKKGKKRGK
jgi:hypothetical protein